MISPFALAWALCPVVRFCPGLVVSFAFAVAALTPGFGRANPSVPRTGDGEGVKFGTRSAFHGGFALTTGLDSNVFANSQAEEPRAAAYILPTAWLGIGNRLLQDGNLQVPPRNTGRILDYNISTIAAYRQFLARDVVVRSQPNFTIGGVVRLAFFPGRRFSLNIDEDFFRGADPANYQSQGDVLNFNRIDHRGALTLIGRPGGGRLSLAVGFRNEILRFGASELENNNRMVNGLTHETKWRFMPRSALVFRYDFDWTFYTDCCTEVGRGRNEDSFAHRLMGGYRGQTFKKFTFDALVGWGFGYYRADPNGPNFSSVLVNVGMNYYPTLTTRIHLAGFREFGDSLLGNYYVDNGGRLSGSHTFRWRMLVSLGLAVAGRTYHGLPEPGVDADDVVSYAGDGTDQLRKQDVLVSLDARVEQPLGRLFALALTYNLMVVNTNFEVAYTNGSVDELGFIKHLVSFLAAVRI